MPNESGTDVKLEIGHVLFIDIVGYSKLLINPHSEQIQKLKEIVHSTGQFSSRKQKVSCCGSEKSDRVYSLS